MRRVLLAATLVAGLFIVPTSTPVAAATVPAGIKGSAAGVIRQTVAGPDGKFHVDTQATIARLQALHANTYQFLVEAPTDFGDLQAFMPAAQTAGIQVIAYLVPPSECPSSVSGSDSCDLYTPDHKDYAAWGRDIATLGAAYPKLIGWTVDDMDYNLSLFTAAYVKSINSGAQATDPGLNFFLQLYQPTITQTLIDGYAAGISGLIMPFRDGAYHDTQWTQTLQSAVTSVAGMLAKDGKKLIVMLYGNSLSSTLVRPDTDYVTTLVGQALSDTASGQISGVILWNFVLDPTGRPAGNSTNLAHGGQGALVFTVYPNTPTTAGDYAQAYTTLRLDAGSTKCVMVIFRHDDRPTSAPGGYHEKRAYVGGSLVWATDVNYDGTDWYTSSSLDVTGHLTNGSATLVLRLQEIKGVSNYEVTVEFDDITLTGCSIANPTFESDSGWTLSRTGGPVLGSIYQYSATYTTDTFNAVAALFGA